MRSIRVTLIVILIGFTLSVGTVGSASANLGETEYVVNVECPELTETVLDQELEVSEDYVDCIAERKEAKVAASSGLRTIDNLRWVVNQIENGGEALEQNRFGPVQTTGDSVTDWSAEQHERLDAEQQDLIESTALEEQPDT